MLVDHVLENSWRIAASGVDDTFMIEAARLLGIAEPATSSYRDPGEGQQPIDWEQVRQTVEAGGMAIAHETTGNLDPCPALYCPHRLSGAGWNGVTSRASDPYQSRGRYYQWASDMADPGLREEGIVLATPELVAETCSAVILFDGDQDNWPLACHSEEPAQLAEANR